MVSPLQFRLLRLWFFGIRGLYGHSQQSMRSFRAQFRSHAQPEMKTEAKAFATLLQ
jgi:hypothetical protein